MTSEKPRRWFRPRYSLATLMVVVTIACALFGFFQGAFRPEVRQIPFDSVAWKRADPIEHDRTVRSQMIEDVLRQYNFQGWTKQEIVALLGEPDSCSGFQRWDVVYVLGLERGGAFSLDDEALGFKFGANGRVIAWGRSVT